MTQKQQHFHQKVYIFQKGRLMQLEYAIEAINKSGSAIGLMTNEGIVLATQKEDVSTLLEQSLS